jgi:hypothetical protein
MDVRAGAAACAPAYLSAGDCAGASRSTIRTTIDGDVPR